jgi:hypothetical protein
MDLSPCLSTGGTREGRERRQGDGKPCPGPNGALSPASPPGFVTALTTARSRDAPAECFDERLPRRLPYGGVLALLFVSTPQAAEIPPSLLAVYRKYTSFPGPPPHPLRNDPLTLTAARRKSNSEVLQEVQAYEARQGEQGDRDGLVDQVYEQRVPAQRQERPGGERCLIGQTCGPASIGVDHVPEE